MTLMFRLLRKLQKDSRFDLNLDCLSLCHSLQNQKCSKQMRFASTQCSKLRTEWGEWEKGSVGEGQRKGRGSWNRAADWPRLALTNRGGNPSEKWGVKDSKYIAKVNSFTAAIEVLRSSCLLVG